MNNGISCISYLATINVKTSVECCISYDELMTLFIFRVTATLSSPMKLQKFPFDQQSLPIMFESCKFRFSKPEYLTLITQKYSQITVDYLKSDCTHIYNT